MNKWKMRAIVVWTVVVVVVLAAIVGVLTAHAGGIGGDIWACVWAWHDDVGPSWRCVGGVGGDSWEADALKITTTASEPLELLDCGNGATCEIVDGAVYAYPDRSIPDMGHVLFGYVDACSRDIITFEYFRDGALVASSAFVEAESRDGHDPERLAYPDCNFYTFLPIVQ